MAKLADQWLTSPRFWDLCGFRSRNHFEWFIEQKHPELTRLRHQVAGAWLWPASAVDRVNRLREEDAAGKEVSR